MSAAATERHDLAVIPAKARSTRFPGKNKALLAGKPLVTRAVEAALESALFHTVMVSTDDDHIAEFAQAAGAEVPFLRNAALTEDTVETPAVVRDAVSWYRANREASFEWVCILQPTCPLRTPRDIVDSRACISAAGQVDAVVSVSKYHHHPYWALRVQDQRLLPDKPAKVTESRQHLPDLYHPDGTVYWWRVAALLGSFNLYDGVVVPYFTPPDSVLDIDYAHDLTRAESRLQARTPSIRTTSPSEHATPHTPNMATPGPSPSPG